MGLPSRTMWARRNIDVSQPNGFATSAIQLAASYFSWGNVDGHNPNGDDFSPYDWGSGNDEEPYSSSPGATIAFPGSLDDAHDCARVICGAPWRVPRNSDFSELIGNCDYVDANGDIISGDNKLITIDGVVGIRLRSRLNGNILFFAACGQASGLTLANGNEQGYYWSSVLRTDAQAELLFITSSRVYVSGSNRFHGVQVRPIFRI